MGSKTQTFPKLPLSVDDQIKLLAERGMEISDREQAKHSLTHINYYRLRAYWFPYELKHQNREHRFRAQTQFVNVIATYQFDRALRLHLLNAIEHIEISLRCRWAHYLSMTYGVFAHDDNSLFKDQNIWQSCCSDLNKEFQRSHETFAKHYQKLPSLENAANLGVVRIDVHWSPVPLDPKPK